MSGSNQVGRFSLSPDIQPSKENFTRLKIFFEEIIARREGCYVGKNLFPQSWGNLWDHKDDQ